MYVGIGSGANASSADYCEERGEQVDDYALTPGCFPNDCVCDGIDYIDYCGCLWKDVKRELEDRDRLQDEYE